MIIILFLIDTLHFLGTFDVQSVSVESVAGAVDIFVKLASNTDALGCFIFVKSSSDSSEHYQVAVNENDSCITTVLNLERDTYSVLVYDLERDGLPGSTPAVSMAGVVASESSMGQFCINLGLRKMSYLVVICFCKNMKVHGTIQSMKRIEQCS